MYFAMKFKTKRMINNNVLSIILGGGKGSRLYPLTDERSKPAVPIAGKYRLVDIPISNCINSRINKIYVLTQFNSASLNKHVKNTYAFDSFTKGFVDILAAEQTTNNSGWYQGTADAVRQSMMHILNNDFEYALILSGDQLYHMDFDDLLKKHIEAKADLTIATLPVNAKDATGFGIMKTDSTNEIVSFTEKPPTEELPNWISEVSENSKSKGNLYLASMGIYLFNKQKLIDYLELDASQTDFGKDIIPAMVNGNEKVMAYQYEGYWTDIGTIDSFFEANLDLAAEIPNFNLFDNEKFIYTRARMLPPSKISGTTLERTMITEGCIIHASRIEGSIVGIRSRIGKGTSISNSYIMGSDSYETIDMIKHLNENGGIPRGIGERCYISQTIVDKNARIGDDVRIMGGNHLEDKDDALYCIRDGIVIIRKGATIPSGSTIGG